MPRRSTEFGCDHAFGARAADEQIAGLWRRSKLCVIHHIACGGDVKLVGVPTKVIALFEMLGLLALFETHDTIEAAVASFSKNKAAKAAAAPSVSEAFSQRRIR